MTGLTQRQRDCLDAIERLTVNGVAPTYDELGAALDIASKSNVHRLVHGLRDRGWLTVRPGSARSLEVVRPAERPPYTDMGYTALAQSIAEAAGVLAHKTSRIAAAQTLRRIADRLELKPRVAGGAN